jgi:two-component system, response regulator
MQKLIAMLEDDSDDRYLTGETLKNLDLDIQVRFFSSSDELFQFLGQHTKPSLILLDYNSTPENAKQVLQKIKSDAGLRDIPVVILSDTDRDIYRSECYALGAASFIKKPANIKETNDKIVTFFKYWLDVVEV